MLFFFYQPFNVLFKPEPHESSVKHRADGLRDRLQPVRRLGHQQVLELPLTQAQVDFTFAFSHKSPIRHGRVKAVRPPRNIKGFRPCVRQGEALARIIQSSPERVRIAAKVNPEIGFPAHQKIAAICGFRGNREVVCGPGLDAPSGVQLRPLGVVLQRYRPALVRYLDFQFSHSSHPLFAAG